MSVSRNTVVLIVLALLVLAVGVGTGWWLAQRGLDNSTQQTAATSSEKKVLYWYDPMYPQQHFDQPGKSPFMDMELVPRYADGGGEASEVAGVTIDPRMQQRFGVRLATVSRRPQHMQIDAVGRLEFNSRDVAIEQARRGGVVEQVWPLAPGDRVKTGQPLVALRVPEWSAAQQEWLAVQRSGDAALIAAARDRLLQLGLSEQQVRAFERSGVVQTQFVIAASKSGVVETVDARAGMTLMPGQTVARINGLATVWLEVAIPEAQAEGVSVGTPIHVRLPALGAETRVATVTDVLPRLNVGSRSVRLRVELANADGQLRPGMTAHAQLQIGHGALVLAVPTEALIRTGKRSVVMRAETDQRFVPVEVVTGAELGDHTEIVAGLNEGQQVVASGQFLIDSEASVRGILALAATDEHDDAAHAGHDTSDTDSVAPLHYTDATIKAIDGDHITLAHGPFPTLNMPGMTMTFPLGSADLAHAFNVGDRVRVGVRDSEQGLVVEQIAAHADAASPTGATP